MSNCSENKKAKAVNKNDVGKISGNDYKDVLVDKKCLRLSKFKIKAIE